MDYFNPYEVIALHHLPRPSIINLVELLVEDISPEISRSFTISAETKVLTSLRYLAKGAFYSEVSETYGISRALCSRVLFQTVHAINRHLQNISFPNDYAVSKQQFYDIAGFPGVIGAVDGTLIPIKTPHEEKEAHMYRKGYLALNIQAVVDANMRFKNVVAKWPGSMHDSIIFDNSALRRHMETLQNCWLLRDTGYPLRPYLLTPVHNPTTEEKCHYNSTHSHTQGVVESAFGLLKTRFRCLEKSAGCLPFHPPKCCEVIVACMTLHNYCIVQGVPMPEVEIEQEQQPAYDRHTADANRRNVMRMLRHH